MFGVLWCWFWGFYWGLFALCFVLFLRKKKPCYFFCLYKQRCSCINVKLPVSFLSLNSCAVKSCSCLQAKTPIRMCYLIFMIRPHLLRAIINLCPSAAHAQQREEFYQQKNEKKGQEFCVDQIYLTTIQRCCKFDVPGQQKQIYDSITSKCLIRLRTCNISLALNFGNWYQLECCIYCNASASNLITALVNKY